VNAKHKKFITTELIPFILREEGRGFAMSLWGALNAGTLDVGATACADHIYRKIPPCGTVACIGGSVDILRPSRNIGDDKRLAKILGLKLEQVRSLFYGWRRDKSSNINWPCIFQRRYAASKTTLGKAKVAVALLEEVVRTNGACLSA